MIPGWLLSPLRAIRRFFYGDPEESPANQQEDPSVRNTGHQQNPSTGDARRRHHPQGTSSNDARQAPASTDTNSESFRGELQSEVNSELFDNKFRREANEHGELRAECFKHADEARENNDHAAAKKHVNEAKNHTYLMEEANAKAVEYIMKINPNNTDDTIDLHGLRVEEALEEVKKKLATTTGAVLHVIPGRGSHSTNQKAKIKPKIMEYLRNNNYSFEEDNPGSFIVFLS